MQDSPAQPPSPSHRPTSVVIVGTDTVLAAFPATPVQIAHACHALGYDVVVPASWGDELVAAAALERADARGATPAVLCACPRVSERLVAAGAELSSFLMPLVAPPVAAARYLRALHDGEPITVTYLGGCPGARAPDIDARLTPREFLHAVAQRDLVLAELPRVFDSVLPPDRRRHFSLPGGVPAAERLDALPTPRRLACLTSTDYAAEVAQHLLAGEPVLVDLAPRLGCVCSGTGGSTPPDRARDTVVAIEPPRAGAPVLDHDVTIAMDAELPIAPPPVPRDAPPARPVTPSPRNRTMPAAPRPLSHTPPGASPRFGASTEPSTGGSRKRPPVTGFFRGYTSDVPRTRSGEGPTLPRAYVGLRRGTGDTPTTPVAPLSSDRERAIPREVEPSATPAVPPVAATTPPIAPAPAPSPSPTASPTATPTPAFASHPAVAALHGRTRADDDATVAPGSPAALRAQRLLDPAMVRVVPPPSSLRAQRELYALATGVLLFVLLLVIALVR